MRCDVLTPVRFTKVMVIRPIVSRDSLNDLNLTGRKENLKVKGNSHISISLLSKNRSVNLQSKPSSVRKQGEARQRNFSVFQTLLSHLGTNDIYTPASPGTGALDSSKIKRLIDESRKESQFAGNPVGKEDEDQLQQAADRAMNTG